MDTPRPTLDRFLQAQARDYSIRDQQEAADYIAHPCWARDWWRA